MRPRRAGAYARRMRTDRGLAKVLRGRLAHLGRRHGRRRPACGSCTSARSSSAPKRRSGPGTRPRRRRAVEERLRIARELHDSLTHSISVIQRSGRAWRCTWPASAARTCPPALLAIQEAGADAARELRATLSVLAQPERRPGDGSGPRPAGQPGGPGPRGRAPGDRDRDRGRAAAAARRRPGRLPDRAGSAHQRQPARRPGLRVGSPALHARTPLAVQVDDDGPGTEARAAAMPSPQPTPGSA